MPRDDDRARSTVSATREIDAPADRIWSILTDADRLVAADLGVTRIDGRIGPAERFSLVSDLAPGRAFKLRVDVFDPPRRMSWVGGMPLGLFKGVRVFTLSAHADRCVLEMSESFSGPLAGMITRSMPDLTPSFERFAEGVKRLAEGATP